jgi:D-ornithine 4,5-aminomutase subunit beta
VEKGVRDRLIILGGGTQIISDLAVDTGLDMGFGRGTKGSHVATFLVKKRRELRGEE